MSTIISVVEKDRRDRHMTDVVTFIENAIQIEGGQRNERSQKVVARLISALAEKGILNAQDLTKIVDHPYQSVEAVGYKQTSRNKHMDFQASALIEHTLALAIEGWDGEAFDGHFVVELWNAMKPFLAQEMFGPDAKSKLFPDLNQVLSREIAEFIIETHALFCLSQPKESYKNGGDDLGEVLLEYNPDAVRSWMAHLEKFGLSRERNAYEQSLEAAKKEITTISRKM